jgi:hypothetical protein
VRKQPIKMMDIITTTTTVQWVDRTVATILQTYTTELLENKEMKMYWTLIPATISQAT